MSSAPGHKPGHAPAGYTWADYLSHLIAEHGSLAALAQRLCALSTTTDDAASVERALRRLRRRGQRDGGDWGRRLLRVFGLPRAVEDGLRWMGAYHSRFPDLPIELCLDQLRLWDRPPVSESRARVWLQLGFAGVALRQRDPEAAGAHLSQARAAGSPDPAARAEILLVEAFLSSQRGDRDGALQKLDEVGPWLEDKELSPVDRVCLHARWIDQRAFQLNNPPRGEAPDLRGALALYQSMSIDDVDPFVSYRLDAGLAYGHFRLGDRAQAIARAEAACRHAGDSGLVRLRAMALLLLARILGDEEGAEARARARRIAERLGDEELLGRVERQRSVG
ncbi:MAG: hypothetical protein IT372_24555 [Polyangiaceae bacterium]|nr:hypothetical protein [Polyangiaceae bacterium]